MRSSEKGKPDLFDKQLSGTANFRVLLGSDGAINWLLIYSGVIAEPISGLLYSRSAVVVALVYVGISFAALPTATIGRRSVRSRR